MQSEVPLAKKYPSVTADLEKTGKTADTGWWRLWCARWYGVLLCSSALLGIAAGTSTLLGAQSSQRSQQPLFLDTTAPGAHPRMNDIRSGVTHFGYLDSIAAPAGATDTTAVRVLFVGNSLTYYHEMPRIFMALASAGLKRRVVVGLVSLSGMPIQMISMMTDVKEVVKRFPWSYVVLQQKPQPSMFGGLNITVTGGGGMPMSSATVEDNQHIFEQYVHMSAPAKVAVWNQYYMPGLGQKGERFVDSLVGTAARAAGVSYVPVSAAWAQVAQTDSSLWYHLYQRYAPGMAGREQNTHPSLAGSYLIALMLYQSLTGQSPLGLPNTLRDVQFLNPSDSLQILSSTATVLQRAAAATAPLPKPPAFPVIGKPAPPLKVGHWLNVPSGAPPALNDGHVTILNFTAMWCGPCKEVYPVLTDLQRQFAGRVQVVYAAAFDGMSENFMIPATHDEALAAFPKYFAAHHITAPVGIFDSLDASWQKYSDNGKKRQALPKLVIVDGHGIVRDVLSGWRGDQTQRQLRADVTQLAGAPKPSTP